MANNQYEDLGITPAEPTKGPSGKRVIFGIEWDPADPNYFLPFTELPFATCEFYTELVKLIAALHDEVHRGQNEKEH